MSFISFIDLVGITSQAELLSDDYKKSIFCFEKALKKCKERYEQICIGVFSDSAYIQSESINDLVNALTELRSDLFDVRVFFTASLTVGTLGQCIHKEKRFSGMTLGNPEAVKAYILQNQLKGIGINVDSTIAKEHNSFVVDSFYKKNPLLEEYESFKDLRYQYNVGTLYTFLECSVFEYIKIGLLDNAAQRYYYSLVKTVIASFKSEELVEKELLLQKILLLLDKLNNYCNDNIKAETIIATIFNRIMDAFREKGHLKQMNLEEFIEKNVDRPFVKLLCDKLSRINNVFIDKTNKKVLLDVYLQIKSNLLNI